MFSKWFIRSLVAGALFFVVTSCDDYEKDGYIPVTEDKYLISYTLVSSSPAPFIAAVFNELGKKYPAAADIGAKANDGVWVYRINYKTVFKNKETVASGLVCVPMNSGPFPVLSFQNGTNTLHSKAPSVSPSDSLFTLVEAVASTGFIVALPDYLGFGASDDLVHPYLEKESTIRSVTDMLRAVKEMTSSKYLKVGVKKDTYLMGYSQGGWATMAVKQSLEQDTAFVLKASACGAGPYDLNEVMDWILAKEEYSMPYFTAYLINSYIQNAQISITYSDFFNAPYSGGDYIKNLFDGTRDSEYINSKLSTTINQLFNQDFLTNYAAGAKYETLRTALTRNSVTAWKPTSPTLLIHGQNDTFVPPSVTEHLYEAFIALGVSAQVVSFLPIPLLGHQEAVIPWGVASLSWLLDQKK